MKKEGIVFLKQIINSLEEANIKLYDAYENKDSEGFNQAKAFMIRLQRKMSEVIK